MAIAAEKCNAIGSMLPRILEGRIEMVILYDGATAQNAAETTPSPN
jgi:hypothetical protein